MSSTSQGIAAAAAGTDPEWRKAALKAVKKVAKKQATFTTDDVWAVLNKKNIYTPENRAMGPVMLEAKREGWAKIKGCNSCGTKKVMVASTRPEAHVMDIAVYESLI